MIFSGELNIRTKILAMIFSVTFYVMMAGFILLFFTDIQNFRDQLMQETKLSANLVGEYAVSPLLFDDKNGTQDVIDRLGSNPVILNATIYKPDKSPFVTYPKESKPSSNPLTLGNQEAVLWDGTGAHYLNAIVFHGTHYGYIYIHASDQTVTEKLLDRLFRLIIIVIVLLLVTYLIANKLQQLISKPIMKMEAFARNFSLNRDYSQRLTVESNDEIGQLTKAFNEMIADLQHREQERDFAEKALKDHKDLLEEMVRERTQELELTQQELLKKEKLATLGQLIATVSHELRNPLGTIRNSIYVIMEKTKGSGLDIDRPLQRADRNIVRCIAIISELLEYTRTSAIETKLVNMDELINQILGDTPPHDGISILKNLQSDIDIRVDVRRFTQVITNLVENAAQALLDEEPNAAEQMEIQINSHVLDHWLKIEITDNGPGMSPQVRDKIFEPLFTTKGFGVGLGLSVVRQIMDLHKGSIEVESEIGKGTKVTLYFPLTEDEPSAAKG